MRILHYPWPVPPIGHVRSRWDLIHVITEPNVIPQELTDIQNFLIANAVQLSRQFQDGRINASINEDEIIKAIKSKFDIKLPPPRHWYDFAIKKGSEKIPVNIKVTSTSTADIVELTQVSGIGRWTAEMFLIFGLGRPNVLSFSDAGLQRAVRMLYGEIATLEDLGEKWSPWRSVASWYLWRHLDS
jgi:hypothetical protein